MFAVKSQEREGRLRRQGEKGICNGKASVRRKTWRVDLLMLLPFFNILLGVSLADAGI